MKNNRYEPTLKGLIFSIAGRDDGEKIMNVIYRQLYLTNTNSIVFADDVNGNFENAKYTIGNKCKKKKR